MIHSFQSLQTILSRLSEINQKSENQKVINQAKYINFIIKMNKSKTTLTQYKSKQKITISTPTNKKSTNKAKDRPSPCSPRANRIHTLQAKVSPTITKKNKCINGEENSLQSPLASQKNLKGYQTPKFKCQQQNAGGATKASVSNNFFSFGEKDQAKMTSIRGMREREKENYPAVRELNRPRKEPRLR